jgi:N-acetylglucosaminyldiphosphoundecaprenol N-acetyl-beta-D-mannosaminyltransferase
MPNVLGVKLYEYDVTTAVNSFIKDIWESASRKNKLVSATGAHGIVTAQRDAEFKRILANFYCNLSDGMPGVWIGKLKGAIKMKRCTGSQFFETFLKESSEEPIKHFFCGGKEGVAKELKKVAEEKFNNHKVVGTFFPPFREISNEEIKELGQLITKTDANVIWIGLSSPKQEKFAYRLRKYTNANYIVTVGAAFDFHTNRLKKAPLWIQNSGFEWLFRLVIEPRRLFKRYFTIVPLFIYYHIKEVFHSIQDKFLDRWIQW